MQPHGEGGYDAPESSGGLRGDALAQDLPLGREDGGRSVVAARLDAQDEAAPWLLSAVLSLLSAVMAGKSAPSMPKEEVWQHYLVLLLLGILETDSHFDDLFEGFGKFVIICSSHCILP